MSNPWSLGRLYSAMYQIRCINNQLKIGESSTSKGKYIRPLIKRPYIFSEHHWINEELAHSSLWLITFASLTFRWSSESHGSIWQDKAFEIRFKVSHPHCSLKNKTPRMTAEQLHRSTRGQYSLPFSLFYHFVFVWNQQIMDQFW